MMRGVCRTWSPKTFAYCQLILGQYSTETVTPNKGLAGAELITVHQPELLTSNSRIFFTHTLYKLKYKTLTGMGVHAMVYILVKGLLCYTKQFAKRSDSRAATLFTKPFHCLVPAFFRIGMLNISSATSIMVS